MRLLRERMDYRFILTKLNGNKMELNHFQEFPLVKSIAWNYQPV